MDASPPPAGMRPVTCPLQTTSCTGAIRLSSTPEVTWNADQIEKVGIAIKVDDSKKVELPREQHSRVHRLVRSVPWTTRVATRHTRLAISQSYRVAKRDASNFGRCISGVGFQASEISSIGFRRRKLRALDTGAGNHGHWIQALDVAARGPVRSPAPTNVEVTGNADQIERVGITIKVADPRKFGLSHEQHSPGE